MAPGPAPTDRFADIVIITDSGLAEHAHAMNTARVQLDPDDAFLDADSELAKLLDR